jgi:hypothetical protein
MASTETSAWASPPEGSSFERTHREMFAGRLLIRPGEVRGGGRAQRRGKGASRTIVPPRPTTVGRRTKVLP